MMERYSVDCATLGRARVSVCTGVVLALVSATYGQVVYDDQCSRPLTHASFVMSSLKQVHDGVPRQEVLQTLSCIARAQRTGALGASKAAGRAIFHIAENDVEVRKYLLETTGDPDTQLSAHGSASEFLLYVANDEVRRMMRDQLKENWRTSRNRWSSYFGFFKDLGDTEFLTWLEKTAETVGPEVLPRPLVEEYARYVRIQQSVDNLLSYLEGNDNELDRAWVARQALRHGATREQVRNAVLSSLSSRTEGRKDLHHYLKLLRECDEFGILEPGDGERYPEIQTARNSSPT